MAMNVSLATNQSNALKSYISKLQSAKRRLEAYKRALCSNWQSNEVVYISQSIDKAISRINGIISEITSVSQDVKNTAISIRNEEIRRINAAKNALNNARNTLNNLSRNKTQLVRQLNIITDDSERIKVIKMINEYDKSIRNAKNYYQRCLTEYNNAKR